jgi:hypothetical protein
MKTPPAGGNCAECFGDGAHRRCDVRRLFHRLRIPAQEQEILWNMAAGRMNCERFRDLLLVLLQSKPGNGYRQTGKNHIKR